MSRNGHSSIPSLSKGVFVSKPFTSQQSPSKRNKTKTTESITNERCRKLYASVWQSLEKELSSIRDRASCDAIEFVTNFVQPLNEQTSSSELLKSIPTAALLMGINIPDHNFVFVTLIERLTEMENYCISLQAKDCTSLGAMIQKAVLDLVKPPYSIEDESYDEGELKIKKHDCTFQTLAAWYKEKKEEAPLNQRIVIMLEDIESFRSDILQDFILICSQYIERLPIVFVFGVATAMVSLHSLLSQKVTAQLVIEVFCAPKATEVLNEIFDMVLTFAVPFRIGPKVFNFSKDIVVFQDFSTSNFTRMYKYCLWDHFYSNPAALLADFSNNNSFTKEEMSAIREIPSLKTYIQSLPIEERTFAKNDKDLMIKIVDLLNELQIYDSQLNILLDCLICLVKDLHGQPLGKYLVDIYCLMNKVPITQTEDYKLAMKLLNMLSKDDLESKLQLCFSKLSDVTETYPQLKGSCDKIEKLLIEFPSLDQHDDLKDGENLKTSEKVIFGSKTKLADLQAKLKDQIDNKKFSSKSECWKFNVINALNELFGCITLPSTVPLNEVMFYDDLHLLKDQLFPAPKSAIHHALMDPKLNCQCCHLTTKDEIVPTMPAICIAYKIHLEFGKSINIYDWLQCYIAKRSETSTRKRSKKKLKEENLYQAEFFQALSELQHLGIVKAPKKKSDFVTRMTWGPC